MVLHKKVLFVFIAIDTACFGTSLVQIGYYVTENIFLRGVGTVTLVGAVGTHSLH